MFGRKPAPAQPPPRFGEAAVALGLVRPADVQKALRVQAHRRASGDPVPLLGEVMESLGLLSSDQVQTVFSRLLESGELPAPVVAPAPQGPKKPVPRPEVRGTRAAQPSSWWERLKGLATG